MELLNGGLHLAAPNGHKVGEKGPGEFTGNKLCSRPLPHGGVVPEDMPTKTDG